MKINRNNSRVLVNGGFFEVFKVALPLILSSSCHAANMFFDRLMLARHSQESVAAAFTGGLTHFTIACIFIGTVGYTGTFVAQYEGARHRERIGVAMWQGIWLTLLGSLLLTTGYWWAEPLFSCFGHDAAMLKGEVAYFQILSLGSVTFMMVNVLCCFWNGRGRTDLVLDRIFVTHSGVPAEIVADVMAQVKQLIALRADNPQSRGVEILWRHDAAHPRLVCFDRPGGDRTLRVWLNGGKTAVPVRCVKPVYARKLENGKLQPGGIVAELI